MAIQESKKQTDIEKRLSLLRNQLYGKVPLQKNKYSGNLVSSSLQNRSTTITSDAAYLYQDLLKIGIFASLALGIQIVLFFLIKNHVLNLKF